MLGQLILGKKERLAEQAMESNAVSIISLVGGMLFGV